MEYAVIRFGAQLPAWLAGRTRQAILESRLGLGRVVRVDVTGQDVYRFAAAQPPPHHAGLPRFYPATEAGVGHVDDRPPRDRRDQSVPADPGASGEARRFLLETAGEWGLSPEVTEVAQLVVSELVSNAVEHAGTGSTITLELDDALLKISVRDGSTVQPVPRPLDMVSFRGRGLPLIDQVSEEWGILDHSDGKTVWAALALSADGEEATAAEENA